MSIGVGVALGLGAVSGGVIGFVAAGMCAAGKINHAENEWKRWERLWIRDNNRLAAFREKAKKIMVPVRGAKGRITGHETVMERINGQLCLEGRQHECL